MLWAAAGDANACRTQNVMVRELGVQVKPRSDGHALDEVPLRVDRLAVGRVVVARDPGVGPNDPGEGAAGEGGGQVEVLLVHAPGAAGEVGGQRRESLDGARVVDAVDVGRFQPIPDIHPGDQLLSGAQAIAGREVNHILKPMADSFTAEEIFQKHANSS